MTTKFTETREGTMSLIWTHDKDLANMYFNDFLQNYEHTGVRSNTYKRKGYACKDLEVVKIIGYSQGDCTFVKVPKTDNLDVMREQLKRIFYDCPITAIISIEGEGEEGNYVLTDYYDDLYDSHREALVNAIKKSDLSEDRKIRALALVPIGQPYANYA